MSLDSDKIQKTLQQPYDRHRWTELLGEVFPNVAIFQTPQNADHLKPPFVDNLLQIGTVRLGDGKNLAVFEVSVSEAVDLARNRVALRSLIARFVDQGTTHGVLCIFNSTEPQYRFTFVSKETIIDDGGNIKTTETNPRRFTYVLGPGETRRTAAQRFTELASKKDAAKIADVIDAFSVERLNEEFFDLYKAHYQAFVDHLVGSEHVLREVFGIRSHPASEQFEMECKVVRDWVKKLLGRLVFIQFLQKKGWMGCRPSSPGWKGGDSDFVASLFERAEDKSHFYSKYLVPLFFDALNAPERPGDIFQITGTKVPYLNGGLFEDSEEKTKAIDFPPELFARLFEFFSAYNFTIDENDPEENEVGIDPEMLGHIFENLLEENRENGAYYTPKAVVQFMCQQALLQYVYSRFGEQEGLADLIRSKIGPLAGGSSWLSSNASAVMHVLNELTVCDPAVGSGAFPVGMIQEIFWVKLALDPALDDPDSYAALKRQIIETTLYGVDLDPGAVEIARLRCWLSLIVDEKQPRALPNLDFKLVCADSLIERVMGENVRIRAHATGERTTDELLKSLTVAKHALFEADRTAAKRLARREAYLLMLELAIVELSWLRNAMDQFDEKIQRITSLVQGLTATKQKLENTKRQPAKVQDENLAQVMQIFARSSETFAWRLQFAEVFAKGGFDIVIANPPYKRAELIDSDVKDELVKRYAAYTRGADLYVAFFELATDLVKNRGVIAYITSNKYHRAAYGAKVRELLASSVMLQWLIDFDDAPVFKSLAAYPCVLVGRKSGDLDTMESRVRMLRWRSGMGVLDIAKFFVQTPANILQASLAKDGWTLEAGQGADLAAKVAAGGLELAKAIPNSLFYGIKTGDNAVFVVDQTVKQQLVRGHKSALAVLKPVIRGRDVGKWGLKYRDKWLIFVPRKASLKTFPSVAKYLTPFRGQLEPKPGNWPKKKQWPGRKNGSYVWWQLQDPVVYSDLFLKPKVFCPTLIKGPSFCADRHGFYGTDKTTIIVCDQPEVLAAVLNSLPVWWQLTRIVPTRQNGYYEIKPNYLRRIVVPSLSNDQMAKLAKLALRAHEMVGSGRVAGISNIELSIDHIVAEAFGITETELEQLRESLL